MMNWYLGVLKKYAVFTGRARRKEYWMFVLFNVLVSLGLAILDGLLNGALGIPPFLRTIYVLAVLLPGIGVTIRRLHDTNRSGWWFLIVLIPVIGTITYLVFMCWDSDEADNKYGTNPKSVKLV
jgi:uncharacterized membrane protein YhaH (DUF805 family)